MVVRREISCRIRDMRRPAEEERLPGCLGKCGQGYEFWWRKLEEIRNKFIFGVLEIRVSGQIIHFLEPHPKPYLRERERKNQKGRQAQILALSHSDFLYSEAIRKAFC